ncbi:hypothetical protein QFC24_000476 [Naganishia onofrii]|uniref:Uncharacterized protein n=1 Tax=Naganishia onofrii TaxID=1851511 RepID=A0ACC2XW33_9TREE|nr:hypothetical protein QFC24_000476 [Naganishia onofrii]
MEQLASPDAPSTRHLMHESSNGLLPPSNYASHPDFMGGGASLGRQFSIQLTPEQFEKLYLQPGTNAFQVAGWDERGRLPALMLASNNFPFTLPLGDLSGFLAPKAREPVKA